MRIIFVRHAEAVDAEDFDGYDLDRPLTPAGKKSARATFQRMAAWLAKPDYVFSSEAVRARETAQILVSCLGLPEATTSSLLNPGCTRKQFKKLIKTLPNGAGAVVVVGHEPDISRIVSQIVAAGCLDLRVKKGSCIEVMMDEKFRGDLRNMISPDVLNDA